MRSGTDRAGRTRNRRGPPSCHRPAGCGFGRRRRGRGTGGTPSAVHSATLPCMSQSPHGFGRTCPPAPRRDCGRRTACRPAARAGSTSGRSAPAERVDRLVAGVGEVGDEREVAVRRAVPERRRRAGPAGVFPLGLGRQGEAKPRFGEKASRRKPLPVVPRDADRPAAGAATASNRARPG
jgi:hypothetical protein